MLVRTVQSKRRCNLETFLVETVLPRLQVRMLICMAFLCLHATVGQASLISLMFRAICHHAEGCS